MPAPVTFSKVTEAPPPRSTETFAPAGVLFVPASIVHEWLAGEASTFGVAAVSDARTSNVCVADRQAGEGDAALAVDPVEVGRAVERGTRR